ncbi:leucine zipper domain-containing protein [Kocuria marina]|uniref:leucine zipper domain-containing protein n=1 Tax=Kocuria marina TaxID=223184 RepID=UPI0034610D93
MLHANARITLAGRRVPIDRIVAGHPVTHVDVKMGISAGTAWRWSVCGPKEGTPGLSDRLSRPHCTGCSL